ncbi:two-component sensor histidine kinase [Agreia pratensis]|uniref:sensor histidine kinase n=1 Tax=Agreia pratensis TaxID=150121 RepID=UPI00188C0585|nr:histidine kinase [Agreia pratensis]MBF4635215.1 two-component sensor histidine kinase [Agreia pratensis]
MSTDPAVVPQAQAGSSRVLRPKRVEEYDPQRLGLPKPPGFIRTFFRRNPWIIDAVLMGLFYYASIGSLFASANSHASVPEVLTSVVLSLGTTAAILFRRFIPRILAGISSALLLAIFPGSTGSSVGIIAMLIALYALAVYRSARSAWLWTIIGTIAATLGALSAGLLDVGVGLVAFLGYGMMFVIATLIGISVGNRVRYMDAVFARAAQLARERDQQAQLATASERARIAREMHDIVAHSLTVMIALADGATLAATSDPDRAKDAMAHVSEIGRTSLTDMRRVLGVLTEASGDGSGDASSGGGAVPLAPQPTFDELRPLIDSYRAAGLPITLTVSGAVPDDSATQLTVFRVVQEALTNALRYARTPSRVEVAVDFTAASLTEVTVSDDGFEASADSAPVSVGSGRGLIGMRERVALYGGTVEAGPIEPRGWRVHAKIPMAAHPSDRSSSEESTPL